MDYELSRVKKLVSRFDRELTARRSFHGVIQVCQKKRRWNHYEFDSKTILYPFDELIPVFGLTKNWSAYGEGVSWGYLPIYGRLRELSLERQVERFREMEKVQEETQRIKAKDRMNMFEDFARETRGVFKTAFNDINTGSMDKSNDVRRKIDRRIKWE